jgi:hypothetical protein
MLVLDGTCHISFDKTYSLNQSNKSHKPNEITTMQNTGILLEKINLWKPTE